MLVPASSESQIDAEMYNSQKQLESKAAEACSILTRYSKSLNSIGLGQTGTAVILNEGQGQNVICLGTP